MIISLYCIFCIVLYCFRSYFCKISLGNWGGFCARKLLLITDLIWLDLFILGGIGRNPSLAGCRPSVIKTPVLVSESLEDSGQTNQKGYLVVFFFIRSSSS
ncbi:hypothetical protein HanLR1_Chr05g0188381 [Helianthus annuus]|nr:hypothetical protein HanLR1_Chr05g0188381 [Helianthus annuus]